MFAWYVQWNGYEPGLVGAVRVTVPPPPSALTSKTPPLSEVTVCEAPSMLVMVIFAPGLTLAGTWYSKSLMVIFASAAGLGFGAGAVCDGAVVLGVVFAGVVSPGPEDSDDVEDADADAAGAGESCTVVGDELPLPHDARNSTLQVAESAPARSRVFMRTSIRLVSDGGSVARGSSPCPVEIGQTPQIVPFVRSFCEAAGMTTSTEVSVSRAQALAWRMQRQLLDPVGSVPVAAVVRRLGAVLSMDESLAELAVAVRRTTSRPGRLAKALAEGKIIKAFAFRGSMHYLSPEDGGIYLALRAAGRQWERQSWVEHYRLTADDWPDFRAAVREALRDGPLTMAELGESLSQHRAYRHLKPVFDQGAHTLVKPLSWQGDLSLGPPRDGQPTFQRFDRNPRWGGIPNLDDAGPRAIAAYLHTYGPATPEHVHYWLGEGLSAGRRRLDRWWNELGDRVVAVDVEGTAAFVVHEDVDTLTAATPSDAVRFLPGHDQWVMGPGTKDGHVTPPPQRGAVTRKANPVIVGGVVSGTWARQADDLTVTWQGEQARPDALIAQETARLGGILDRDLHLTITS